MPAYVSLVNFTEQGIKTIKGTVERTPIIKKQAEAPG